MDLHTPKRRQWAFRDDVTASRRSHGRAPSCFGTPAIQFPGNVSKGKFSSASRAWGAYGAGVRLPPYRASSFFLDVFEDFGADGQWKFRRSQHAIDN